MKSDSSFIVSSSRLLIGPLQGVANFPVSSRFENKHNPVPSKYSTFARFRFFATKTKRSPVESSLFISPSTSDCSVLNDFRMSHGSPYAHTLTPRRAPSTKASSTARLPLPNSDLRGESHKDRVPLRPSLSFPSRRLPPRVSAARLSYRAHPSEISSKKPSTRSTLAALQAARVMPPTATSFSDSSAGAHLPHAETAHAVSFETRPPAPLALRFLDRSCSEQSPIYAWLTRRPPARRYKGSREAEGSRRRGAQR